MTDSLLGRYGADEPTDAVVPVDLLGVPDRLVAAARRDGPVDAA